MAKETKMQREIRVEAERAATRQQEALTYPARMMITLARAQNFSAQVEVMAEDMAFDVSFTDTGSSTRIPLTYDIYGLAEERLQDLIYYVSNLEFQLEESRRLERVRVDALAKLSDEEQLVLGLKKERDAFSRW